MPRLCQLKTSVTRLVSILFPELEKLVPSLHTASVYALFSELPGDSYIAECHLTHLKKSLETASKAVTDGIWRLPATGKYYSTNGMEYNIPFTYVFQFDESYDLINRFVSRMICFEKFFIVYLLVLSQRDKLESMSTSVSLFGFAIISDATFFCCEQSLYRPRCYAFTRITGGLTSLTIIPIP